jgi:hypothetical protein
VADRRCGGQPRCNSSELFDISVSDAGRMAGMEARAGMDFIASAIAALAAMPGGFAEERRFASPR